MKIYRELLKSTAHVADLEATSWEVCLAQSLRSRDVIHIDTNNIVGQLPVLMRPYVKAEHYKDYNMDIRPPGDFTWLEWTSKDIRHAVFCVFEKPTEVLPGGRLTLFMWVLEIGFCLFCPAYTQVELKEDGTINEVYTSILKDSDNNPFCTEPDEVHKLFESCAVHLWMTLITFSLLNCKNVILRKENVPPKLQKKRKKRHSSLPDIVVRKLELTVPGTKLVPTQQRETGESRLLRWHQVRGHVADYSEGKGLFGRYHGRFYIPQHGRGSMDTGRVVKRYEIKGAGDDSAP
jgi:hypothetical protein